MSEANKIIVRRMIEKVHNHGEVDAIDELCTPDMVNHTPMPGVPNTNDGVKQFFTSMHAAFPDLCFTIHDQIAEGEKVFTRMTFEGTHNGEFMGIPATGRQVSIDVIDTFRLQGGRITDHWGMADQLSMMQQMGIVSPPGQAE